MLAEPDPFEIRPPSARPRVVIIGAGFAGGAAARALRRCDTEIVLIDRRHHHIFQPFRYQEATAVPTPSEIAARIRQVGAKQANLNVMLGNVVHIDLNRHTVEAVCPGIGMREVRFDFLVVATGMHPSYFGHDELAAYAPGLKNLADADADAETEGAMLDWSAVLLTSIHKLDPAQTGFGYSAFAVAMTVGRLSGDWLVRTIKGTQVITLGALLGAIGLLVAVFSPAPSLAFAGFVLIGLGVSNLVPVIFRAAGRQTRMPPTWRSLRLRQWAIRGYCLALP